MKLNQYGFGLGGMIFFLLIFVLAILLIAIQASSLGIGSIYFWS